MGWNVAILFMIAMPFLLLSGIVGYCWHLTRVAERTPVSGDPAAA